MSKNSSKPRDIVATTSVAPAYLRTAMNASYQTRQPTNKCDLCNFEGGATRHTPDMCCVSCRNYNMIDVVARTYTLAMIKEGDVDQDNSFTKWIKVKKLLEQPAPFQDAYNDAAQEFLKATNNVAAAAAASKKAQLEQRKVQKEFGSDDMKDIFESILTSAEEDVRARLKALSDEIGLRELQATLVFEATKPKEEELARDQEIVAGISRRLVQYVNDDMAKLAKVGYASWERLDSIDRARFFYSWIAGSITYNMAVREHGPKRTDINTLKRDIEVCLGIAKLFKTMFDATNTLSINPSSVKLETDVNSLSAAIPGSAEFGISRPDGQNPTDADEDHMWNSFPIKDENGKTTSWKLIDVTQATRVALADGSYHTPSESRILSWFTRSNAEFLRTHSPTDNAYRYMSSSGSNNNNNNNASSSNSSSSGPTPPVLPLEWFHLPAADTYRDYLDYGSIAPRNYTIDGTSSTRQIFQYAKKCPHLIIPLPLFALRVGDPHDDTQGATFHFAVAAADNATWTADVDLAKAPRGVDLLGKLRRERSLSVAMVCPYEAQEETYCWEEVPVDARWWPVVEWKWDMQRKK